MKRILILLLAVVFLQACTTSAQKGAEPAIAQDAEIEKKVEALLSEMTLEEKIGQMTQLTIDVLGVPGSAYQGDFQISEAMLDTVIGIYKVGSILNTPGTTAQTREKWHEIISKIQDKSMEVMGIPTLYGLDQIHGSTYILDGTMFPQTLNMGATFNRSLVRRGGEITAYETKAGSVPWTFAPTVDLGRDARWPRMWENFGEDAYVNAEMGREAVLGHQGENPNEIGKEQIAVCMKHYMGYGAPFSGKDRTPSIISERQLREKHFAPFLEAIRAGALSVMGNSGSVNGMPVHASHELLTEWLKEDLNWDGMIVTDWADINNLYTREKIAKDKKEAIKLAINAGIDMAMEPYSWDYCVLLKELVEEGEVKMSRIDDAVRRVLRMKYRLGLFETPVYEVEDFPLFGGEEFGKAALQAAEESIVLLKNEKDVLPLADEKKILVTGPNANSMRTLNGGWSYTWQGTGADKFAAKHNTIQEAFKAKFGSNNVVYEPGVTYNNDGQYWEENEPEIEKAVAAARGVDVIFACIGENSYCETPGNLTDLTLSENQRNLVKALSKTGKPIVLVINSGRPRVISDIEPLADAVIDVMLPGNFGGDALANLVSGDVNFSGKLPFSYPKAVNSLGSYDYKPSEQTGTMEGAYNYNSQMSFQWAFGYGLSYTDFDYSNLSVDKSSFTAGDELTFTVDVTNTGDVAGKESVLLFSSDLVASLTPDVRRLRNFEKVEIQPGETKTVTMTLKGSDLAFVGSDGKWVLEEGDFKVQVGDEVLDIVCAETKKWETPNI
ncbi:glycoside hydrolase family 3 N-terminal domain-containing protein [Marinilabilia salmonicolor]|jgi:beta-glucosidase|uniref:beta-glucosidase n=1 Tax=Marinilabilia salmonicolor TaxID=989 RepID=A0A2T0XIM7_9BACT|nr:glycoside hydrolase family 3 N-terminal domain-containing protein [Marinilabilia salmonicolor]PRY98824.1 beta-glucosidase [Marinilabilia salmonicolor]RCW38903.1 beta-glucosidase [Marinilabilia salmonicolor]